LTLPASRRFSATVALAALALAVAGCADGPRLGESGEPLVVTKMTELPPPAGADAHGSLSVYRVGPLDKLAIVVAGVPELTDTFRTDTFGRFQLPFAGEIDAAGLSTAEVAATIRERLRGAYVRNPQVAVNLEESDGQVFTVGGQVNEAGSFPIDGHMTLLRAVARAKGPSEFARLDDVVVFRTVAGERMAALYNLDAIRRGTYADPSIYAGDTIEVGDSTMRRRMQQFLQVAPLLTTPIIVALQRR